jgi:hypothetical protein
MKTRNEIKRFEVIGGTTALTPALSPRRGRIVRRFTRCRVSVKSPATSEQHEAANCCSLSSGERVRVRASVKTNFLERDGIHIASYVTKAIPKKQLEQKLHQAVRLTRARLEEGRKL